MSGTPQKLHFSKRNGISYPKLISRSPMAWILGMELTPRTSRLFIATEWESSVATTLIERLHASCNATVGILGDGMLMWEVEGGVEGERN
jgi:hypothetical protein